MDATLSAYAPGTGPLQTNPQAQPPEKADKGGFGFWDFVDIINPLQHIPVVNKLYRKITGDEIGSVARIAGAGLYTGGIGAGIAAVNVGIEKVTGRDLIGHALAALKLDKVFEPSGSSVPAETLIAQDSSTTPVDQTEVDISALVEENPALLAQQLRDKTQYETFRPVGDDDIARTMMDALDRYRMSQSLHAG